MISRMTAPRAAGGSFTAAVALAAVTVFVFYTLRDYGPASAVRRFHNDIRSDNFVDLSRVCSEPIASSDVARLKEELQRWDDASASARIAGTERSANEVEVLVFYQLPSGTMPLVWVVDKDPSTGIWKVDPGKTLRASSSLRVP